MANKIQNEIVALGERQGIVLLADEIYDQMVYDYIDRIDSLLAQRT